ncbi:Chromo domain-like protein [Ascosphaera apis ARSEF 7405]|uniref:Chromo domain-like protein n=1 Tax=Ascosphaera apis ARSEF 7405 TaxID=392613 RepID=A0A167VQF8_9EURO|nr:Chromo domain-like protein [Ascosphaera apis ARSEF 7405]
MAYTHHIHDQGMGEIEQDSIGSPIAEDLSAVSTGSPIQIDSSPPRRDGGMIGTTDASEPLPMEVDDAWSTPHATDVEMGGLASPPPSGPRGFVRSIRRRARAAFQGQRRYQARVERLQENSESLKVERDRLRLLVDDLKSLHLQQAEKIRTLEKSIRTSDLKFSDKLHVSTSPFKLFKPLTVFTKSAIFSQDTKPKMSSQLDKQILDEATQHFHQDGGPTNEPLPLNKAETAGNPNPEASALPDMRDMLWNIQRSQEVQTQVLHDALQGVNSRLRRLEKVPTSAISPGRRTRGLDPALDRDNPLNTREADTDGYLDLGNLPEPGGHSEASLPPPGVDETYRSAERPTQPVGSRRRRSSTAQLSSRALTAAPNYGEVDRERHRKWEVREVGIFFPNAPKAWGEGDRFYHKEMRYYRDVSSFAFDGTAYDWYVRTPSEAARLDYTTGVHGIEHWLTDLEKKFKIGVVAARKKLSSLSFGPAEIQGAEFPKKVRAYPMSPAEREIIEKTLQKLHDEGKVSWSKGHTPSAYPVFVTYREIEKDGEFIRKPRVVVDIRKLNEITEPDVYPVQQQEDLMLRIGGKKYLSVFDAASFFYQWLIHPAHRQRMAVISHRGQETFNVAIMGYINSIAYVARQMANILRGCEDFCVTYVDDIVVYSATYEDHLFHLRIVLNRLRGYNITLSPEKTFLGFNSVTVLGQRVSSLGMTTTAERIHSLMAWKFPRNHKELERYLGAGGEVRFHPTDMELACIVWVLRKIKVYVELSPKTIFYTDHASNTYIAHQSVQQASMGGYNMRLTLGAVLIRSFRNVEVKYIRGKDNIMADALSRNPGDYEDDGIPSTTDPTGCTLEPLPEHVFVATRSQAKRKTSGGPAKGSTPVSSSQKGQKRSNFEIRISPTSGSHQRIEVPISTAIREDRKSASVEVLVSEDIKEKARQGVVRQVTPLAFELDLPATMKVHPVVSVAHLDPVQDDYDPFGRDPAPVLPVKMEDGTDDSWEIETLLDRRDVIRRGRTSREYLVRWKGFGPEEDRWYSVEDLQQAQELMKEFDENLEQDRKGQRSLARLTRQASAAELDHNQLEETLAAMCTTHEPRRYVYTS